MVSAQRNLKNIFPRPLFIIIFRPEMLKFHPHSILTGDTRVEFVIYSVLRNYFNLLQWAMDSHAMGFYIRMHDYNSLNLINITQNLLHGTTSSKAKSRSRNPLWFYVPDSLCWKKHTLHFQTLTVGLNELLNSRSHMRNKTEIKLY